MTKMLPYVVGAIVAAVLAAVLYVLKWMGDAREEQERYHRDENGISG